MLEEKVSSTVIVAASISSSELLCVRPHRAEALSDAFV